MMAVKKNMNDPKRILEDAKHTIESIHFDNYSAGRLALVVVQLIRVLDALVEERETNV